MHTLCTLRIAIVDRLLSGQSQSSPYSLSSVQRHLCKGQCPELHLVCFHQSSRRLKIHLGIHGTFRRKTRTPLDPSVTATLHRWSILGRRTRHWPLSSLIELDGADY